jgi:hypothetical protein
LLGSGLVAHDEESAGSSLVKAAKVWLRAVTNRSETATITHGGDAGELDLSYIGGRRANALSSCQPRPTTVAGAIALLKCVPLRVLHGFDARGTVHVVWCTWSGARGLVLVRISERCSDDGKVQLKLMADA